LNKEGGEIYGKMVQHIYKRQKIYVHEYCYNFSMIEKITIGNIVKVFDKIECSHQYCSVKLPTIQCKNKKCTKCFHLPCIKKSKGEMMIIDIYSSFYCSIHAKTEIEKKK